MDDSLKRYQAQFQSFLDNTHDSRDWAETSRNFVNLKQWTEEEEAELRARKQAPVVFDYCREQLDYFLGIEAKNRHDPKAYPRTQEDQGAAEAVTDALRYVADNANFDSVASDSFDCLYTEGIEACIVDVEEKKGDFVVTPRHIAYDRFYYDPASRNKDFSDASYMGIVIWMDKQDAMLMFPDAKEEIEEALAAQQFGGEMFDDAPLWADRERNRVRVCQHYVKEKGVWYVCYFSGDVELLPKKESPYLDEYGDPQCPIVARSAYITRDNQRYGYNQRNIYPQREVNARRSKAYHLLSSRQVLAEDGVVKDIHDAKSELKKPDGWLVLEPGALTDGSFQISPTNDMGQGQWEMYQDAKMKLDAAGANAAMQGEVESMSGKAIGMLQEGGATQVNRLFDCHSKWKLEVYRHIWNRIKQFWDAPKWIRVTDTEDHLKFVGLNQPVTIGQQLQEAAEEGDQEAAMVLEKMVAAQDPRLNQVAEVENQVAEIDVDIVLDEGINAVNQAAEQFESLINLAQIYGPEKVPFEAMLELSSIPNKEAVKEMLSGGDDPMLQQMQAMQQQMQEMMQQMQMQSMQLELQKQALENEGIQIKNAKTAAEVEQTQLENETVKLWPDVRPNVNI